MKRILLVVIIALCSGALFAQPVIDLGLKAGMNISTMNIQESDLLTESGVNLQSDAIVKMHWGAFGRVGFGRVFVQPEVYFTKKGADLNNSVLGVAGGFDYKNVDAPVLLGYRVIKGKLLDLHLCAGPVFSFVTDASYPHELDPYLKEQFFKDHLWAIQYGVGVDVLFMTIDARMEHAQKVYRDPSTMSGKGNTFMISVGFKIL